MAWAFERKLCNGNQGAEICMKRWILSCQPLKYRFEIVISNFQLNWNMWDTETHHTHKWYYIWFCYTAKKWMMWSSFKHISIAPCIVVNRDVTPAPYTCWLCASENQTVAWKPEYANINSWNCWNVNVMYVNIAEYFKNSLTKFFKGMEKKKTHTLYNDCCECLNLYVQFWSEQKKKIKNVHCLVRISKMCSYYWLCCTYSRRKVEIENVYDLIIMANKNVCANSMYCATFLVFVLRLFYFDLLMFSLKCAVQ